MVPIKYTKGLIPNRAAVTEMMSVLRVRKTSDDRFYRWEDGTRFIYLLGWGIVVTITHKKRYDQKFMDITYRVGEGSELFLISIKTTSYMSKRDIIRFIEQAFYQIMFQRLVLQDKLIINGKKISEWETEGLKEVSDPMVNVRRISYVHSTSFHRNPAIKLNDEWFEPIQLG